MHAFDRQTDRQTDRIPIAIPRLHLMQRGKNEHILIMPLKNNSFAKLAHLLRHSVYLMIFSPIYTTCCHLTRSFKALNINYFVKSTSKTNTFTTIYDSKHVRCEIMNKHRPKSMPVTMTSWKL